MSVNMCGKKLLAFQPLQKLQYCLVLSPVIYSLLYIIITPCVSLNFSYGKPGFLNVDLIIYAIYGSVAQAVQKARIAKAIWMERGDLVATIIYVVLDLYVYVQVPMEAMRITTKLFET